MRLCVEAQLGDPELLQEAIAFYRLVAAWLLQLACPSGQPSLPLPEPVPMSWATLPEWFVEDVADFFLYVSRWGLVLGALAEHLCDVLQLLLRHACTMVASARC